MIIQFRQNAQCTLKKLILIMVTVIQVSALNTYLIHKLKNTFYKKNPQLASMHTFSLS